MSDKKRGQALSLRMVIIAIILLLVLIVVINIFTGRMSIFGTAVDECPGELTVESCTQPNWAENPGEYGDKHCCIKIGETNPAKKIEAKGGESF